MKVIQEMRSSHSIWYLHFY